MGNNNSIKESNNLTLGFYVDGGRGNEGIRKGPTDF
jgi:hypothetical protein